MKKIRAFIATALVLVLCLSLCACSSIMNMAKSTTYNTGDIKDGFSTVKAIDGVEFVVASEMKDEAKGEMEFMATLMNAIEDEDAAKEFAKTTYELKDATTYALVNYSISMVMVMPTELEDELSSVESAEDLEDILGWDADNMTLRVGNSYVKSNLDNITKVICPVECEVEGTDGKDETMTYKGYVAVVENDDEDAYMMLAVSLESDNDNMKYIAKSLSYTGEPLAEPEEDDDDDEVIELPTEDDNDEPTIDITPTPDEPTPQPTVPSQEATSGEFESELASFKFKMDGTVVSMPMKLSDFMAEFDMVLDSDYKDVKLNKNEYAFVVVERKSDDNQYLFIDIANMSDKDNVPAQDCVVFCVEADKYDLYGYSNNGIPHFDIVLPGGVVVDKTTEAEVLKAYGTPDETYTTDESSFTYYTWKLSNRDYDYYSFMEITIDKENNLVYAFEYSTMP